MYTTPLTRYKTLFSACSLAEVTLKRKNRKSYNSLTFSCGVEPVFQVPLEYIYTQTAYFCLGVDIRKPKKVQPFLFHSIFDHSAGRRSTYPNFGGCHYLTPHTSHTTLTPTTPPTSYLDPPRTNPAPRNNQQDGFVFTLHHYITTASNHSEIPNKLLATKIKYPTAEGKGTFHPSFSLTILDIKLQIPTAV